MEAKPLRRDEPVIDAKYQPLDNLNQFTEAVCRRLPMMGAGDPEGVAESTAPRIYIRTDGPPWLYVKPVNSVAGDRKAGWEAV